MTPRSGLAAVAAVVLVGVLVEFSAGEVVRAIVVATLLTIVIVTLIRARLRAGGGDRFAGSIGVMWVLLTIGPMHTIARRPIYEAVNSPGADSTIEIIGFAVVAAWCVVILRELVSDWSSFRAPALLFALPIVAVASSAWSSIGLYTFGKGMQLLVIALLASTTLAFGRQGGDVEAIAEAYLRSIVRVTFLLIVARAAFGPLYITATGDNLKRYSLIGMHPNLGAFLVAVALVITVGASRAVLRVPALVRAILIVVFGASLIAMHSRTSVVTLLVGIATLWGLAARRSSVVRFRYAPPLLASMAVACIVFWDSVFGFILRGGDSGTLATGNGRIGLWGLAFRLLRTPFGWLFGLGYGEAKVALIDELPWATTAHNSVLSMLIGLGLVGVAIYLLLVSICVRSIIRARLIRASLGPTMVALLGMLVAQMAASDAVAEPSGGFVLLYLLIVVSTSSLERGAAGEPRSSPALKQTAR